MSGQGPRVVHATRALQQIVDTLVGIDEQIMLLRAHRKAVMKRATDLGFKAGGISDQVKDRLQSHRRVRDRAVSDLYRRVLDEAETAKPPREED